MIGMYSGPEEVFVFVFYSPNKMMTKNYACRILLHKGIKFDIQELASLLTTCFAICNG